MGGGHHCIQAVAGTALHLAPSQWPLLLLVRVGRPADDQGAAGVHCIKLCSAMHALRRFTICHRQGDTLVMSAAWCYVSQAQACLPGMGSYPHGLQIVMCIMITAVNGQPLHAAYCLQMLPADSSSRAWLLLQRHKRGLCSHAACHPGVVQRCGRPACCNTSLLNAAQQHRHWLCHS